MNAADAADGTPDGDQASPLPETPPTAAIPDADQAAPPDRGAEAPPDPEGPAATPVIRGGIRHGDLGYARYPVLAWHYLGGTIVSAERALDQRLNKALSERMQLGLYPGLPDTHTLFFNEDPRGRPAGALVVGLGQVGDLAPGLLETVVRDTLVDYALRISRWPDGCFSAAGTVRSATVSCLLVGFGPEA